MDLKELNVRHYFGGGVYAKETEIPEGVVLAQHKHKFAHLSILASGTAAVHVGDEPGWIIVGPTTLTIEAGIAHRIEAKTFCVWYCIHATDELDSQKVDATLIAEG